MKPGFMAPLVIDFIYLDMLCGRFLRWGQPNIFAFPIKRQHIPMTLRGTAYLCDIYVTAEPKQPEIIAGVGPMVLYESFPLTNLTNTTTRRAMEFSTTWVSFPNHDMRQPVLMSSLGNGVTLQPAMHLKASTAGWHGIQRRFHPID